MELQGWDKNLIYKKKKIALMEAVLKNAAYILLILFLVLRIILMNSNHSKFRREKDP